MNAAALDLRIRVTCRRRVAPAGALRRSILASIPALPA